MANDVMINASPMRYRRDLRGSDLAYEFFLMLDRLRIGDELIIPNEVFVKLDGHDVSPPPYPHTRWRDDRDNALRVRRDG